MNLQEFIKHYHGATADHLSKELFGETIGDDQDLSYPNNYIMILMHQVDVLKKEIETLKKGQENA